MGGGSSKTRKPSPAAGEETPVTFLAEGKEQSSRPPASSAASSAKSESKERAAEPVPSSATSSRSAPSSDTASDTFGTSSLRASRGATLREQYVTDLFDAYAVRAALDAKSLCRMMGDMRKHTAAGGETTEEDGAFVVGWMDQDGDNSISLSEFKSWLLVGLQKPLADLEQISSKGDRGIRLVEFIEAIRNDMARQSSSATAAASATSGSGSDSDPQQLETPDNSPPNALGTPPFPELPPRGMSDMWIQDTFKHFDTDGDDRLDAAELFQLCAHVKQWALKSDQIGGSDSKVRKALKDFSPKDALMVLRIIDKDADGSIDSGEFSEWVLRGLKKSDVEMAKVMSKNRNAAKMVALVVAIRLCITETTAKRSDLEKSLLALFRQYDSDGDGSISKDEMLGMMRSIEETAKKARASTSTPDNGKPETEEDIDAILAETAALIHGTDIVITQADVDFIMTSMDTDGSGTLEKQEWLAWLRAGLARTDQDLDKLPVERSGLTRFIKSLRKFLALQASSYMFFPATPFEAELQRLFERFDNPGDTPSGQLLPTQLLDMMVAVVNETTGGSSDAGSDSPLPTQTDADFIVSKMDIDGDGYVSLPEFIAWVTAGLGKSSKELRLLAERSERHSGLVTFLQCLQNSCSDESKNVAAEYAALAEKYRNAGDEGSSLYPAGRAAAPLRVRISRMFSDYDVDGNGSIDQMEMLALLVEVGCYLPYNILQDKLKGKPLVYTSADASIFIQSLDEDGNGTIEREEFIDWVSAGLAKAKESPQVMEDIFNCDAFGSKRACFVWSLQGYLGETA